MSNNLVFKKTHSKSKTFRENYISIKNMRKLRYLSPRRSFFWFHKTAVVLYRSLLQSEARGTTFLSKRRYKMLTRPQLFSRYLFLELNQFRKIFTFLLYSKLPLPLNMVLKPTLRLTLSGSTKLTQLNQMVYLDLIRFPSFTKTLTFNTRKSVTGTSEKKFNLPKVYPRYVGYTSSLTRFNSFVRSYSASKDFVNVEEIRNWHQFSNTSDVHEGLKVVSVSSTLPSREHWLFLRQELEYFYSAYSNLLNRLLVTQQQLFRKSHKYEMYHDLIMKFNDHRLSLILTDHLKRRNHFVIGTGMLLKYMEGKKKSAKKSLSTKLVLMRFLRKLLLVSGLTRFELIVKGVPLFLPQLLRFLKSPLPSVITDPLTQQVIDETGDEVTKFSFERLVFLKPKPFGYQKTRKKGRIKRKIRRKIISKARVIDEA